MALIDIEIRETQDMPHRTNQLLVFRFGQIGDTIAALPSLWVLRQQYPDARIVMLSEVPAKSTHLPPDVVLPQCGLVDGFEKYPGGASVRNFVASWRQIRRLRKMGFATLVYLVPSERTRRQRFRDQVFFRSAGIRHFLATKGFYEEQRPRSQNGSMIPLPKEADALLGRLKLDGLAIPDAGQGCLDLRITEAERSKANIWWRKNIGSQPIPDGWVAICIGGKTSTQLWPLERYAEVVRLLIEKQGIFPVIVGGTVDRARRSP